MIVLGNRIRRSDLHAMVCIHICNRLALGRCRVHPTHWPNYIASRLHVYEKHCRSHRTDVCHLPGWLALGARRCSKHDWLFPRYRKTKRSQGPDFEGLEAYADFLLPVLRQAPRGLPNYSSLRRSVELLEASLDNMAKPAIPDDVFYMQSAGRLKLMAQHARHLAYPVFFG